MTKLNVRPREVRIWYKSDGSIEWKARVLKPSEIAMMGVVLQDGALRTLREVTPDGPKSQVIVLHKCSMTSGGKTRFRKIWGRTKVPNYDGPIPESDKQ
jgi:hypothetical protein